MTKKTGFYLKMGNKPEDFVCELDGHPIANVTDISFKAPAGEPVRVTLEVLPDAPIDITVPANVVVVIKAVEGIIVKYENDGVTTYKVLRQPELPGT